MLGAVMSDEDGSGRYWVGNVLRSHWERAEAEDVRVLTKPAAVSALLFLNYALQGRGIDTAARPVRHLRACCRKLLRLRPMQMRSRCLWCDADCSV